LSPLGPHGKGGELAGRPVATGRAAVISEEGADNWDARALKLAMGNHVSYFCRPFKTRPSPDQWQAVLDAMLELRRRGGQAVFPSPATQFKKTASQ
jgi:hypothetical protein